MNKKVILTFIIIIPIIVMTILLMSSGSSLEAPDPLIFNDRDKNQVPDYAQKYYSELNYAIEDLKLDNKLTIHLKKIMHRGVTSLVTLYVSNSEPAKVTAAKTMKCITKEIRFIRRKHDLSIVKLRQLKKSWDRIKTPEGVSPSFISATILRLGKKAYITSDYCFDNKIALSKRANRKSIKGLSLNPLKIMGGVARFMFSLF
jgi:hypothetical protein